MAATPFPPPTPEEVQNASSFARDWGTLVVGVGSGLVAIFVGAWHLVVRWAKRHEERQAIKFAAVEARLKVLEADSHLVALKIAKLEMIADQVENLSSRLEAGFAGLNTRLDGIAMMRQP
jgi:H+/gluconate symporter-like permease